MSPALQLRAYAPGDLPALLQICLQTMDQGRDATALFADGRLPGLFYAAPYVTRDPSLCWVACLGETPCGYVLGTDDSRAFEAWCEHDWFPGLRARYPAPPPDDRSADAKLIRLIHQGYHPDAALSAYPGHLHIDLLPCIQRQGVGTRLIQRFADSLRARGCPACHLGVNADNTGACAFYEAIGLREVHRSASGRSYGWRL